MSDPNTKIEETSGPADGPAEGPPRESFALYAHPHIKGEVVLWPDRASLIRAAHGEMENPAVTFDTRALCQLHEVHLNSRVPIRADGVLWTMHFVRGDWDTETFFHECCHALRVLEWAVLVGMTIDNVPMAMEEPLCYSLGKWADQAYRWLWEQDAHGKLAPAPPEAKP